MLARKSLKRLVWCVHMYIYIYICTYGYIHVHLCIHLHTYMYQHCWLVFWRGCCWGGWYGGSCCLDTPTLMCVCDMADSYVGHDWFISLPTLMCVCDMTDSYVWHDWFTSVTQLVHVLRRWVWCIFAVYLLQAAVGVWGGYGLYYR